MGKITEVGNKLTVIIEDKYLKEVIFEPDDGLVTGAIKCLRDQGKVCEYFGINSLDGHVVTIDGIKYCTSGTAFADISMNAFNRVGRYVANLIKKTSKNELLNSALSGGSADAGVIDITRLSYEIFCIVDDTEHDYKENHWKNRADKIISELSSQSK